MAKPSTFPDTCESQISPVIAHFFAPKKSTLPLTCSGPTRADLRFELNTELSSLWHASVQRQSVIGLPPPVQTNHFTITKPDSKVGERTKTVPTASTFPDTFESQISPVLAPLCAPKTLDHSVGMFRNDRSRLQV